MPERIITSAEQEAREAAIDIYRTLGVSRAGNTLDVDLWRELLVKTRSRFEKFRYKPADYERYLFVPQVFNKESDEQIVFRHQLPSAGYQPTIEWRQLQRKAETKDFFTAILCLKGEKPTIHIMHETFSVFIVKDRGIDNLLSEFVPKMQVKYITVSGPTHAYFGRDELGIKVESGHLPIEEAIAKISIPK